MPKNKVSDLITDQEIAFARLVDAVLDRGGSLSCPVPHRDASPGGVAKVAKRPNFIEFYKKSPHLTRN